MEDKVQLIINGAIDRLNELLPADAALSKGPATVVLGQGGGLDSMGFVNLLVALEEELDAQLGLKIALADEISPESGISTLGEIGEVIRRVTQRKGSTSA